MFSGKKTSDYNVLKYFIKILGGDREQCLYYNRGENFAHKLVKQLVTYKHLKL